MTDQKTQIKPHSIFNDVLGPIMAGPSSSHSAGCARIGRTTALLYGEKIQKAVVVFDAAGSYPSTYIGQGSNFGFTGGLLGFHTDDPRLKDAVEIAKDEGIDISFSQEMLSHCHPNEARIDVYDANGDVAMQVLTLSTGGGTFEIINLDGFPVFIDGSQRQVFVECSADAAEKIEAQLQGELQEEKIRIQRTEYPSDAKVISGKHSEILLTISRMSGEKEAELDKLAEIPGVQAVRHTGCVLPVELKEGEAVFADAKGALAYQKESGKSAPELALAYETSIGEATEEEIREKARYTLEVMRKATEEPDPETTKKFGFMSYQCRDMKKQHQTVTGAPVGCLDKALFYAVAVMENSCAHHTIVAAPTAGSSGVIPAAILAVGEEMHLTEDEMIDGLLASGLTGAFIANLATFGAEVAGCQAENGAAGAMAAAGIVQMLGGTVEQGFMAASMAIQNILGLICDPVGGLTEIPCISRNVSTVANAITAANMVMYGFNPIIPLDESIETMYRVGQQLPAALRCTCEGGLCTTPTGKCLAGNK